MLKAWIDHIVCKGLTLGNDGHGLASGKRAAVLLASGRVYTEGSPIADRDITSHYLWLILTVIGIVDVTVIAGSNAKAVDMTEQTMDRFVGKFNAQIRSDAFG